MNIKIKRILFAVLIIINCIVIFNFSAQDSEKSSETSGVIVDRVVNTISSVNKKVKKETLRDVVSFYTRKTAHFSIYALLGIWLINEANTFDISKKRKVLISVIFGLLYAMSDEFHQSFVGERSPEINDVFIDTLGFVFGIMVVILVIKTYQIYGKNRKSKMSNHV